MVFDLLYSIVSFFIVSSKKNRLLFWVLGSCSQVVPFFKSMALRKLSWETLLWPNTIRWGKGRGWVACVLYTRPPLWFQSYSESWLVGSTCLRGDLFDACEQSVSPLSQCGRGRRLSLLLHYLIVCVIVCLFL